MSVSAEEKKDAPLATKTVQADGDAQEGILEMWSLAKLTGLDKLLWGGLSRLAPSLGMEPETLVMGVQQFAESSTSLAAADTEKLHQLDQKLIETHAVLKNVVEQCEPRFKSLEASKVSLGQRLTKLELANSDAERKAEIAALGERLVKLEQGKTKTQRKVEVESGLEDLREDAEAIHHTVLKRLKRSKAKPTLGVDAAPSTSLAKALSLLKHVKSTSHGHFGKSSKTTRSRSVEPWPNSRCATSCDSTIALLLRRYFCPGSAP